MKEQVEVSAPGKLMLLGDHAVVYNRPCIVTAVSARVWVMIEKKPGHVAIEAPQVKNVRFVEEAISVFKRKYRVGDGFIIKTKSDFSCRYGLGSSSAVAIATLLSLSRFFKQAMSLREIFNLGYQTTLNIQGIGSGFDIAAAVYGKTIYFLTGGKVIEPLGVSHLPLVVGYSGVKADTATMVKNLRLNTPHGKLTAIFDSIQEITERAKAELLKGNWEKTGKLMNENHRLLSELGVSTNKLDKMCQAAREAGAYGAKLSGAGGGDCMIALVPEAGREKIERAIERVGGVVIKVSPNAEGVRIEA